MVNTRLKKLDALAGFPVCLRRTEIAQILGLIGFGFWGVVQPAAAHHAMEGRTPASFLEGFLSGVAHPVIGLDHLAFVVAIGLLSVKQVRGALLPLVFVVTAMVGTGLHIMKVDLPVPEIMIALSVIALGLLLAIACPWNFGVVAGLAAIAGLFHGYAYGESIVGAEMTPLVAYLLGFTVIQLAISLLAFWLGRKATQSSSRMIPAFMRYFGYGVCVIGVVFSEHLASRLGTKIK